MKVLFPNPKSWKLTVEHRPEGDVILNGVSSYGRYWSMRWRLAGNHYSKEIYPLTEIDNIVFIADVQVESIAWGNHANTLILREKDSPQIYITGAKGIEDLFKGLQDGTLELVDGWIRGVFTFEKRGPAIYLYLWKGEDEKQNPVLD